MTDANEWPSHTDELGRKTTDVIERLMASYDAGKITLREIYLTVSMIYDTVSGLAPKDVCDLLADLHKELRIEAQRKAAQT